MYIIIRSAPSGVWFGQKVRAVATTDGLQRVTMKHARRVHYWTGAGSCSGLASHGPSGGRIAVPVSATVSQVCEIIEATDEAVKVFNSLPEWRP